MNGRVTVLLSMFLLALSTQVRATDVTGTWRVTISTSDGTISGMASFKQIGEVVTGWVGPNENDPITINGILKKNKLTLKTSPRPGRTVAFNKCDLTVNGDKMAGTIVTNKGVINKGVTNKGDSNKGTIEFVKSTP